MGVKQKKQIEQLSSKKRGGLFGRPREKPQIKEGPDLEMTSIQTKRVLAILNESNVFLFFLK